jgi:integrase
MAVSMQTRRIVPELAMPATAQTGWTDIQFGPPASFGIRSSMQAFTRDLFTDLSPAGPDAGPEAFLAAFDAWATSRAGCGELREQSSVDVYRSMWGALTAWCVGRGLALQGLGASHLEAYLHGRGGAEDLTPRHAWRLLTLVDAVSAHHADANALPRNNAAQALLMARPDWRYANAADKTPLPEHLAADEARRLVAWLLDPATQATAAGAPPGSWQSLRNRAAVGLQLGAGLAPGDIRLATTTGVVSGNAAPGQQAPQPWKIALPAHGGAPAREAPIAPWAGRLLQAWLQTRQSLRIGGDRLFPAAVSGRPWGKVAQYTAAKAVLTAAGLPGADGGSFRLRHTFALRQLQHGSSPEQVAQWMGLRDAAALARHRRLLMAPADIV